MASAPASDNGILELDRFSGYADTAVEMVMLYVPRLLLALIVLIVGLWIINRVVRITVAAMERRSTEPTLTRFIRPLISIGLKILLLISVASMVGIATTSFIAVLGAAGLAIGLALQGSLANFAGGVLVLVFKPYKIGDYVEAQGVSGTVIEIQIFNTLLNTPDNKRIIVPNGAISNGIVTNYSTEPTRRVDLVFPIRYQDDIDSARAVVAELIAQDERAFRDPQPEIVVSSLGENGVNLAVRVWSNAATYWGLYNDLTERTKRAFEERGIGFPSPRREVYVYRADGAAEG